MKHGRSKKDATRQASLRSQRTLLPLVAVSGSLAALPASALELGDMNVQSGLGQPLRASIAFVLAPSERLSSNCVSVGTGMSESGLPGVGRTTVSVADGVIQLVGRTAIREPMVAANVRVNCPYTMKLNREYTLFINPVDRVAAEQAAIESTSTPARRQPAAPVRDRAVTPVSEPVARAPRREASGTSAPVKREPIGKSTRYQVQPGDSLSQIAERIENRPIGLWSAVNAIFEANPEAFINNDPNKVMAGSWLEIPSFDGSEPILVSNAPPVDASVQSASDAYPGDLGESVIFEENAADVEINGADVSEIAADAVQDLAARPDTPIADDIVADAGPADAVLEPDNPFVDYNVTSDDNVVIPDTELAGPATASSTANVPTGVVTESAEESQSSWLMWLAGTGVVLIIGLLLFGRFFRRSDDLKVIPRAYPSSHRFVKDESSGIEVSEVPVGSIDSDAPTEENLVLDADLSIGSGLTSGPSLDTAQQPGGGIGAQFEDSSPTVDTLQTLAEDSDDDTILESEILPDGEDYDLSVIIDATKMPQPEDVSQRDLKAVAVNLDDTQETDNYTINREVDFDILAQDYEDEFTATQAVNTEITRAAAELANDLGADDTDAWLTTEQTVLVSDSDETVLMTKEQETAMMKSKDEDVAVTAFDVAEQLQLSDEEASDLGDLDETLSETNKMNLLAEDYTLEMAAAENDDDTREMDVDGDDTVETKVR